MSTPTRANPSITAPTRPLPKRIAIIGAGTIGPDIGYYLLSAIPGLELTLVDVAQAALDRAEKRLHGYIEKGLKRRKLSEAQAAQVRDGLRTTLDYDAIAGVDWVLEAATEDLPLKQRIFAQVEALVGEDTIITSNTSSLPAERIFAELKNKSRATVTHFFAPAHRNPAVEVIRAEACDDEVVEYLRWVFAATGKVPLETSDALCFMLDRVFDNWCNEAAYLLEHATASEVDSVAADYVHAGPFFVLNMARGNPIIVEANTLQMEEGAHYQPAEIFRSVDTWTTLRAGKRIEVDEETTSRVQDRLLGILFSQSVDILDRGIASAADLDLGCKLALGFKRGPLELMGSLGDERVAQIFARLGEERAGMPVNTKPLASYQDYAQHVLVDDIDGVCVITLRRPQAMNALDDKVTEEILAVIKDRENDVEGFVLVGYGPKAFCAGADIGRFPALLGDAEAAAAYARDCAELQLHLDSMKVPVVAALNGMTLGGGLELALRCHSLVAVKNAVLQFPEVNLGIAPGLGGMVVPYRRWPAAASVFHDMIRFGDRLKAVQAHELGVLDGLADDYASLIDLAVTRVKALKGSVSAPSNDPVEIGALPVVDAVEGRKLPLSREVVGLIEDAIVRGAAAATLEEALEIGYQAFGAAACTAAAKEGVGAFIERRKADFVTTG